MTERTGIAVEEKGTVFDAVDVDDDVGSGRDIVFDVLLLQLEYLQFKINCRFFLVSVYTFCHSSGGVLCNSCGCHVRTVREQNPLSKTM